MSKAVNGLIAASESYWKIGKKLLRVNGKQVLRPGSFPKWEADIAPGEESVSVVV